jgi:hypothetical protein
MHTCRVILFIGIIIVGAWGCVSTGSPSTPGTPMPLVFPSATPADTLSGLIEGLLNDERADVQIVSAYALADMGATAESAVPYLIRNLQNQNSEVQISAIRALAAIGSDEAVEPLTALLDDDFVHVRMEAVIALGKIGDPSAVPELVKMLDDSEWVISASAAEAIGIITGEQFPGMSEFGGFDTDEAGRIVAVVAAQEWWEQEGQYMDWSQPQP